jgi:predicted Zn-dependent protease
VSAARLDSLEAMLRRNPGDTRIRFALATEYEKLGRFDDVVAQLRAYLAQADDQGNAWGRLGHALFRLGRAGEARDAYAQGVEAARAHGHPSMAAEFQEILEQLE